MSRRNYYLFLLAVGIVMVVLNHLTTPTLSDDVLYRFVFQYDESAPVQPIACLHDLITSQWVHYHIINGRIIIHAVVQAVLWLINPYVFHVVNALMFVILLHLCIRFIKVEKKQQFFSGIVFFALFFFIINDFQSAFLWNIGSINYLWTMVVILIFLLYLHQIKDEPFGWKYLLLSPFAFLVGWTHEGIHLALTMTFVYYIIRNIKKSHQAVFPFLLFFIAGSICCMLSPGLWNRFDEGMTLNDRFFIGVLNLISNIRIVWILLLLIIYAGRCKKEILKAELQRWHYIYIALFMALGIVFICGTCSDRVGIYADFLASLLLVSMLQKLTSSRHRFFIIGICCVLSLIIIPAAIYYNDQNSDHEQFIEQQLNTQGQHIVSVRRFDPDASWFSKAIRSRYVQEPVEFGYYVYYQAFNARNMNNRCAAVLHHRDSVVFIPEDVMQKIHHDSKAYDDFELDEHKELFVKRIDDNRHFQHIIIKLNEEVKESWLYKRLLSYPSNEYEVEQEQFNVLDIEGKRYVIFTKPTTNIYRRIKTIELL